MEKETFYQRVRQMIISSTKKPKYTSISPVKTADLLGMDKEVAERFLEDFVKEGRLQKKTLPEPPHNIIYLLP
ncbi:PCI domain-containing protein [Bacillus massiliglaciei]|uniref:PCI domain-containing protein n=1 Tax=Bacillus massiliglaciei TaxID=1816693 RepID=UPI000DA60F45|nr:hypothetical protein [Bacillus massiliglaciei]